MERIASLVRNGVLVVAILMVPATTAVGQLISIKSVPVANGDQFLVYPSKNLGMGGVSIALDDPWLDPFVNPAKASRLDGSMVFSAPVFYNVTNDNGGARTLPVGASINSEDWFAGGILSIQELKAPQTGTPRIGPQPFTGPIDFVPSPDVLSERSATNTYFHGFAGTRLTNTDITLAGSVALAELNAVDGVEHLYALSNDIDQFGHSLDVRFGLLRDTKDGRAFELVLLHNRFNVTHDVSYIDWVWDEAAQTGQFVTRTERNIDRTNTVGAHLQYSQPITSSGWRAGGIFTANYKSHPKIPNYEIMNIPRDPGNSWAYNFGGGLSQSIGDASFGVDIVYEPIWSNTWAEAEVETEKAGGGVIPPGGKTIENDFRFSNALIRLGLGRDSKRFAFRVGLQIRSISYRLKQFDYVAQFQREQNEQWMEWTPTWGAGLKFKEFELRYSGRVTTGTGRPGVAWTPGRMNAISEIAALSDFIVAPSGPLTLQDASVITHQFSVAVPIR